MKRFNTKIAPLFIAGTAIFALGTAFKYIFLNDDEEKQPVKPKSKDDINAQDHLQTENDVQSTPEPETPAKSE